MPTEIEVKYKVPSLEPVESKLRSSGAAPGGEVLETDTFFDTPGGDLARGDRGLRLRRWLGEDGRPCGSITYKGPVEAQSGQKVRQEIESSVGDVEATGELLRGCGFEAIVTIQKRRRRWLLDECEVSLDALPLLGTFVEIEGPSGEAIESVRRRLDLDGEPITTPYFRLLAERCPRMVEDCGRATFENCDECEHGRSA